MPILGEYFLFTLCKQQTIHHVPCLLYYSGLRDSLIILGYDKDFVLIQVRKTSHSVYTVFDYTAYPTLLEPYPAICTAEKPKKGIGPKESIPLIYHFSLILQALRLAKISLQ